MNKETNKMIPEIRFPEFVEDGEWVEKKLDEVCEKISQGGTPDTSNSDYWNGLVEWITPAEMGKIETRLVYSTVRKITEAGLKNCSSDLLPINSVILSTRAPIGHLVINKTEMAMNQGCKALIPNKQSNPDYLYYFLLFHKKSLSDLGAGNTFKELSANSLKSFQIQIPSISEQQKIASCLSSLDEVIAAHSQKLELLKEQKKGLMQNLFPQEGETVPKYRFPEFVNDGEWVKKRLGDIGEFLGGGTPSRSNNEYWIGNIPWISSSDISDDDIHNISISQFINEEAVKASATKIIPKGSILFVSRVGVGKLAINIKAELCTSQDFTNFLPTKVLNYFIAYYFSANKNLLKSLSQGTSIQGFSKSDLEDLIIGYPVSSEEQQKIATCLSSLDALITAQADKIEQLKLHKKGLMQGLFPPTA